MKVAKKRVLLTYSWNRVGYNILRALSDHGYDVYSADIVKTNICSVSNRSKESLVYHDPFKEEDLFIEDILTIIEKYKIDILLPTHDEGLILSKYKDRFPSDIILAVEDENKLNKLSDKAISTILFKNLGLPVPECFKLSDVTNELYPLIVKGIVGNSSKNVFKVRDKKDLDQALSQLNGQDYLIQSFIGSCDYSVDCVRFGSKFYGLVYKATLTKTKGGGTSSQREIVDMPQLIEYARILLDKVDYNGVCGLDFRVDEKTGKSYYIETNTRFTGGIATPIKAGFNIPCLYLDLLLGNDEQLHFRPINGIKTKWILGDIITLFDRLIHFNLSWKELKQILSFRVDSYDDFFRDDPKIFFGEVYYYFRKLVINRKLNP